MTMFMAVVLAVVFAIVVAAALTRTGRAADVLDWDPTDRMAARDASDAEELERGLAEHNARRASQGLPPEDELELRRRLARERRL